MTSLSRILFLRPPISRLLRPGSGGLNGADGGRLISISPRQLLQEQDQTDVDKMDSVLGDSYKAHRSPVECVDPDELEKFAQQAEILTSIDEHRQAMPPFVKGMLEGKESASRHFRVTFPKNLIKSTNLEWVSKSNDCTVISLIIKLIIYPVAGQRKKFIHA